MLNLKVKIMSAVIGVAMAGSVVAFAAVSVPRSQTTSEPSFPAPQSGETASSASASTGSKNIASSSVASENKISSSEEVKKVSESTAQAASEKVVSESGGKKITEKTLSNGIKVTIVTDSETASQKYIGPPIPESSAASSSAASSTASK